MKSKQKNLARLAVGIAVAVMLTPVIANAQNGLAARWPFAEGSGMTTADSSGNGNTGTLNNSPVWVSGLAGDNALEFPGAAVPGAAYVSVPNSATLSDQGIGSNLTICAWVKRSAASVGNYCSVVAKDVPNDTAPYHRNYELIFDTGSHILFAYRNSAGTAWELFSSSGIYTDTANWHFYCVTYTYGSAASCTIYVDGAPVTGSWTSGNGSDAPASTSKGPLLIGIDGTGTAANGSAYDFISIYGAILSSAEINTLFTDKTSAKAASATTVSSSLNPAPAGTAVTFTATVSGSGWVPTGTVNFLDGGASLGSGTLNGSGVAALNVSTLSAGVSPHSITAVYSGDVNFNSSTSGAFSETITNATVTATNVALTSAPNPALAGSSVTFTATISETQGTPAGSVTFYNGGASLGSGTLNASGVATFSISTLLASASPYAVTAVYGSVTSSVLSQVITNSGTTNSTNGGNLWTLSQPPAVTSFPVATFRPTSANSVMTVDEMPNGIASDTGSGIAWRDLFLEDCFANNTVISHALHAAAHQTFMEISSQGYNGGTPLPLLFGQGNGSVSSTTIAAGISNNIFYAYNGIGGVTDGSAAVAGRVGEYLSASLAANAAVELNSGATGNVTSIVLTPGDWDVEGVVSFNIALATVTSSSGGTSVVSATNPSDGSAVACGLQFVTTTTYNSIPIPRKQITVSTPTAVYLVGTCYFSAGSVSASGQITARRMR